MDSRIKLSIHGGRGYIGTQFRTQFEHKYLFQYSGLNDDLLYLSCATGKVAPRTLVKANISDLIDVLTLWCAYALNDGTSPVFNYISSAMVYPDSDVPLSEESPVGPRGLYATTKSMGEMFVRQICEENGLPYRIIRLANVVGGSIHKSNGLHRTIRKVVRGDTVSATIGQVRDYIHVQDVCTAIDLILQSGEKNAIYNVATGIATPITNMLDVIFVSVTGEPRKFGDVQFRVNDDPDVLNSSVINVDKLKRLGFVPQYDLPAIVAEFVQKMRASK